MAADKEDLIEEWWLMPNKKQNLFDYLCVDKLKLCCQMGIFGANCDKKCPGIVIKMIKFIWNICDFLISLIILTRLS